CSPATLLQCSRASGKQGCRGDKIYITIWPVSGLHGFLGNILVYCRKPRERTRGKSLRGPKRGFRHRPLPRFRFLAKDSETRLLLCCSSRPCLCKQSRSPQAAQERL